MTGATTHRGEYVFTVKEHRDGTYWILLELLRGPALGILETGLLGFDLLPGTTMAEAQELAAAMNARITTTAHTLLVR